MKVEIDVSEIIKAVKANVQSVDTSDLAIQVQESLDIAWLTDQVVDEIDLHDLACKVKDEMDIYHLQRTVESLENTVEALVRNMNKYRNAILAVGILDGGQDD